MSRTRTQKAGAAWQTEFPPFGDPQRRRQAEQHAAELGTLQEAVAALLDWRERHASSLRESDELWIEARLEERVAALRFEAWSSERIRSVALSGEPISELRASFAARARSQDATELESLAAELRRRYKPPILPVAVYLPLEVLLSERLMRVRSLEGDGASIAELRARRGVVVHQGGLSS
jgi:methane monooxygenase component A gamma chain